MNDPVLIAIFIGHILIALGNIHLAMRARRRRRENPEIFAPTRGVSSRGAA